MTTKLENFLSRVHDGGKTERELITIALAIAGRVTEEADKTRADRRLSDVGRQAKIVDFAAGGPWAYLTKLKDSAVKLRESIATFQATLFPKDLDQSEVVRAMRLQALCDLQLEAKRADRLRIAMTDDPFAEADLLAPHPSLSGISTETANGDQPSEMALVLDAYRERNYPEQLDGIKVRERSLEAVNAALTEATRVIITQAGVTAEEIEHLAHTQKQPSQRGYLVIRLPYPQLGPPSDITATFLPLIRNTCAGAKRRSRMITVVDRVKQEFQAFEQVETHRATQERADQASRMQSALDRIDYMALIDRRPDRP
jgi:hypothetical protein